MALRSYHKAFTCFQCLQNLRTQFINLIHLEPNMVLKIVSVFTPTPRQSSKSELATLAL